MRVKLCATCPYTPRDLADHYDPAAALHLCATCDVECGLRETQRRRTCPITTTNTIRTALCSRKCVEHFKIRRDDDSRWLWRFRVA
jgi:hypothetical protein